jgi:hypothetical protein
VDIQWLIHRHLQKPSSRHPGDAEITFIRVIKAPTTVIPAKAGIHAELAFTQACQKVLAGGFFFNTKPVFQNCHCTDFFGQPMRLKHPISRLSEARIPFACLLKKYVYKFSSNS